jgi:DNA primase
MPQRAAPRTIQPAAKRSLVRGAIAVLLQQPSLALTLGGKHHFQGLRLPGVELLLELLGLVEQRPDISTGALLEHFDGREEQASLHTLAAQTLAGDEAMWTVELHDAVGQLEKQLLFQRIDDLNAKQRQQGLDDTDKYEMRELLKARANLRL